MATELKYNIHINLTGNELRNALFQSLSSAPTAAAALFYYNSTNHAGYVYNGTAWRPMDAALLTDGSIANTALTTNPLARANHTGTQTASTISDLSTTVHAYTLDSFAAPAADVAMGSHKLTGLANGTASGDAVNFAQMNSAIQSGAAGIAGKGGVVAVATTNVASLSGTAVTVDGVALNAAGLRVLLTAQTTTSQNGPWVVSAGAWTRPTTDSNNELETGAMWFVEQGTVNAATQWWLNSPAAGTTITPGTTAIGIVQFSGGGTSYSASSTGGLALTSGAFSLKLPTSSGLVTDSTGVYIDTAIVTRKYSTTLATSSTSYTVTHNLGTRDVIVVVQNTSTYDIEMAYVSAATTNTVTIGFAVAPTSSLYRVTVHG